MPLRTFYIIIKSDYVDNKGYLNLFPWMKIHGSIEALWNNWLETLHLVSMNENSWLYWSTWRGFAVGFANIVSMNENSWLYWSLSLHFQLRKKLWRFHEWKFMALLKHYAEWKGSVSFICFHEWKFMALLKLECCYPLWRDRIRRFHEWKFMALLKHAGALQPEGKRYLFPWMKIHGSIEAR